MNVGRNEYDRRPQVAVKPSGTKRPTFDINPEILVTMNVEMAESVAASLAKDINAPPHVFAFMRTLQKESKAIKGDGDALSP